MIRANDRPDPIDNTFIEKDILMKSKDHNISTILIILWLAVIFGHSLMPGSVSSGESSFVTDMLIKVFPFLSNADDAGLFVRKAAHFSEFAVLGMLVSARIRDIDITVMKRVALSSFSGLVAAFTDETIQLFVEGRAGSVADMWIDLGGTVTGTLIAVLAISLIRSRQDPL